MTHLPHLLVALVGCYGVLGVVILYRALQPSCRNCANRHTCPNRREGFGRPVCVSPRSRAWFERFTVRRPAVSRQG